MRIAIYSLMLALAFGAWGCKDVLEPDLSKKAITLVAPNDNDTSINSQVTFWWQKLDEENAYKYRLQVVKPNFNTPQLLVVDTLVSDYKFTASLYPGNYQWRVRSENNASYTPYVTRSLVIDSAKDLSTQYVTLISPANGSDVNTLILNFSWQPLPAAKNYTLKLLKLQSGVPVPEATIPNIVTSVYTYTATTYGTYQWRVTAENDNSTSQPSNTYTFTLSLRKPDLLIGQDSVIAPNPEALSWTNYSPAAGDSIQIFRSSIATVPIVSTYVLTKTYSFPTSAPGSAPFTYFWRVKSVDGSGNTSAWTLPEQFKVK